MHNPESPTSAPRLLTIQSSEAGQRLDRYLGGLLTDLSRTAIQQRISAGEIQVNGRGSKAGYLTRSGDEILIAIGSSSPAEKRARPQALPLEIVYEDEYLLILDKTPGMVVHPAPGHYEDTVVNALLARYPDLQNIGSEQRPGIVHRLDRDTSGLLIVAKDARTQTLLIEQMQRHEIIKRYIALVEGVVSLDQGSIDAPIGRDPQNRQQMAILATGSREARTHFRVLERFARHTLLLLQLETGRTHQIRVHLKAIGHPVVSDPMYGSGNSIRNTRLRRQFLHASQLHFTHPITGAELHFEIPLPADLQEVLDQKSFL